MTSTSQNTNPENAVSNATTANAVNANTNVSSTGTVSSGTGTDVSNTQNNDTPAQVIQNADGSITYVENDGTQNIFNPDGSVKTISPDGNVSNPLSTEPANGVYPDGNGGFTDINGNPTTIDGTKLTYDTNGNLILPDGTVYSYAPPYASSIADGTYTTNGNTGTFTPTPGAAEQGATTYTNTGGTGGTGGGSGLTSLVNSLLNPFTSTNTGKSSGVSSLLPAVAAGAAIAGLANSGSQSGISSGMSSLTGSDFGWNPNAINSAKNGIAYGQQILNPVYTPKARAGGMVSHFADGGGVDMPTITQNGLMPLAHGGHIHHHVYEALKEAGHPIDNMTVAKVTHLASLGAPAHHIVGFMNHQRSMASGGPLGAYSDGGHFLKGPGDGMSDDIPANIGGHQEARLANEEFVVPADVVSHLGNGSSEAGAKVLYRMMDKVRHARTGTTKQGKQIKPEKFMPK